MTVNPNPVNVSDDFAAKLTANGYVHIVEPEFDNSSKDEILILIGGGTVDLVAVNAGGVVADISRPRVQIQVRDANFLTGRNRAYAILKLLHRGTVNNCIAVYWDGQEPRHWIDDNRLWIFEIEFKVIRELGT